MLEKQQKRHKRHKRVRAKIYGTSKIPRLCVFRSNKHIYAQLIDDEKGMTLVAASNQELKSESKKGKGKTTPKTASPTGQATKKEKDKVIRTGKVAIAFEVGKLIAEKALKNKIEKVVFDRGGYKYHGRVMALAEGARDAGLKF